jgi:hypothetical protein
VDPIGLGDINGIAPYGRLAWQRDFGNGTLELGAFALKAAINPGRDRSTGLTDHYSDVGLDASYICRWRRATPLPSRVAMCTRRRP